MAEITLGKIQETQQRISDQTVKTSCNLMPNLSKLTCCQLYFKLETLQRCNSFKFRGAYSKIMKLPRDTVVVCASGGNHSQGCACACQLLGMKCIVYLPITAPLQKVEATLEYGAEVIQYGMSLEEAITKCKVDCTQHQNWTFISPGEDEDVIAGNGTIALEILEQVPDVDTVIVPVGEGALCAGVSVALKELKPDVRIVAVNSAIRPATYKKYQIAKGRGFSPETNSSFKGSPLADGLAVLNPGKLTFPYIEKNVDEFVVVTEDDIALAIAMLAERTKILAEGAGAAPFAALWSRKIEVKPNEKVVCIISGGCLELTMLSRCIDRALFLLHRRIHFTVSLPVACTEFINMLEILHSYKFEIIGTAVLPNANSLANHTRYSITVDIPNPALLQEVQEKFVENGWIINITDPHAIDE